MENKKTSLTRGDLRKMTGAEYWLIDYLYQVNKLPVFKESAGHGFPRLYGSGSVQVVQDHLAKRSARD